MAALVGFAGSRSLSSSFAPLVGSVVASVLRAGRSVASGCSAGADSFALSAALAAGASPVCFAVGAANGFGFAGCSAPLPLLHRCASRWLAGGPLVVPLVRRLPARSRALVAAVAASGPGAGLVVFFASPSSRGSRLAARVAAAAGLPVLAFACGFPASSLPSLGRGRWVAVRGAGPWASAFRWLV